MASANPVTYSFLLGRAWPIILANAAVPMLGLVDTAVIGNFGSLADLGAIAFGSLIFSFVYWSFGFLRMSTTGFTAQAWGAGDQLEVRAVLGRALLIALSLAVLLLLLQWPIAALSFALLDGSAQVEAVGREYFFIRIWGAPATLTVFVCTGLLIGQGKSRKLLSLQLFLNGLNIALDVLFAGVLNLGAAGIALGTVIAEWSTVAFAFVILLPDLRRDQQPDEPCWPRARIMDPQSLMATATANVHIMLRTLMLVFSFAFFVNQSARFGDVVLAANHILLQMISFSAFFLDGYAFVVESLVGAAKGQGDRQRFDLAVQRSSLLALFTAILLALLLWLAGDVLVAVLTDIEAVRASARQMLHFAVFYVLLSFAAFQLDGIFIGVSQARQMRDAAALSLAVFILAWWLMIDGLGVSGLWLAMILYVVARALALLLFYPGLRAGIGPSEP